MAPNRPWRFRRLAPSLILAAASFPLSAQQPTEIGTDVSGAYGLLPLSDEGVVRMARLQAGTSYAPGVGRWEFISGGSYVNNWRPYTSGQELSAYDSRIDPATETASARWNSFTGGQTGLLPAVIAGNYYTFIIGENAAANNFMSVLETTFNPIAFTGVAQTPGSGTGGVVADGQAVTVTVSASAGPSAGENVFLRYTTDGFASSAYVPVTFTGATGTATIPAQATGTTVQYYVLSTETGTPSDATIDFLTLVFENNGTANYSYAVIDNPTAVSAGDWSTPGTWNTGTVPATGMDVTINANVNLDVDAEIGSLSLTGGTLTDGGAGNTLTIQSGGAFTASGGSFSAGSGTVSFAGSGSVNGTVTFQNVALAGGVNFGTSSTVNGELRLNAGAFVDANRPAYGSSSTVVYQTGGPYGSSIEWEGTTPANVRITATTSVTLDASIDYTVDGDLSIDPGSSLGMATGVGNDLFVGGDWTNNGSFDNGGSAVFLDGSTPQTINGSTTFDFLLVDNPAGISLAAGAQVRVDDGMTCSNGTFTTTGGTLTLLSDASGTAWLDDFSGSGNVSGTVIMQRLITGAASGFHFLSAPLSGATINGDLSEIGPSGSGQIIPTADCDMTQTDPSSPYGNVMQLEETGPFPVGGCEQSAWYVVSSGPMTPGRGYACIIPTGTTIDIDGSVPSGPVSFGPLGNTTTEGDGWHLVGNPFPSPINWTAPTGFASAAQLWQTSGSYTGTFQPLLSGTGQIGSMQGFQVRVPSGTATFTLDNTDRTTGDPTFYRAASWYDQLAEIDLYGNGFADKTAIYFAADGTSGWEDDRDAHKKNSAFGQPTIYTLSDAERTAISGQGPFVGARSIPLGLLPGADGSFTFSVKTWEGFPATARLFLEDLATGTWTDLLQGDYTATMGVSENPDRFVLHFRPGAEAALTMAGCADDAGRIDVDLGDGSVGGAFGWTAYTLTDATGTTVAAGTPGTVMAFDGLASGEYALELRAGTLTAVETYTIDAAATASAGFTPDAPEAEAGLPLRLRTDDPEAVSADWAFGDGQTATGVLEPLHTWTEPGFYTVEHTVYSADGCVETESVELAVRGSTGVPSAAAGITVWTQGLTIGVDAGPEAERIALTDLAGRRVANAPCTAAPCTIQAPAAGYYLLLLERNGQRLVRRVAVTD